MRKALSAPDFVEAYELEPSSPDANHKRSGNRPRSGTIEIETEDLEVDYTNFIADDDTLGVYFFPVALRFFFLVVSSTVFLSSPVFLSLLLFFTSHIHHPSRSSSLIPTKT